MNQIDRVGMLIANETVDSESGQWIEIEDPAHKLVFAEVPRADSVDIDRAVAAAKSAFPAWSTTPAIERGRMLDQIGAQVESRAEELARLMSRENGNALRTQSRGEARAIADVFRYFGGLSRELKGRSQYLQATTLDYTRREPHGVVAAIVPWNSPLALAAFKIAPALCSGNTVVMKASEVAPLAVLELARICADTLPPGVLNVLTGYGDEAGAALVEHRDVAKISFTGSTMVGRSVLRAASERIVPVSLELGGKGAQIVLPGADVSSPVPGVIGATRVSRQGQSCSSGSRIFVHESLADEFVGELTAALGRMRVGDPLDESTDIGSLVSQRQFERVTGYVEDALADDSGTLLCGGLPPTTGELAAGWFFEPTVFCDVRPGAPILQEEIFGPVFCVSTWRDEADVVARANDTDYGLAAFLWGDAMGAALRIAHQLDVGYIMVNQAGPQPMGHSYGGNKRSGMGRELSLEGMLESYTTEKQISIEFAG